MTYCTLRHFPQPLNNVDYDLCYVTECAFPVITTLAVQQLINLGIRRTVTYSWYRRTKRVLKSLQEQRENNTNGLIYRMILRYRNSAQVVKRTTSVNTQIHDL